MPQDCLSWPIALALLFLSSAPWACYPDVVFVADANNTVEDLADQANGKISAVDLFTAVAGRPRNRMASLNFDGGVDVTICALRLCSVTGYTTVRAD